MKLTNDPAIIEHRLLELVYTTDTPITPTALAYFAKCSVEDAEKVLDALAAKDRIQLDVADDGTLSYVFPNRHKITPRPEPVEPRALVPHRLAPLAVRGGRTASPTLAALLSVLIPGAGQLYTGNVVSAILWFILVGAGYVFLLPGLFLHLCCIAFAASAANRLNSSLTRLQLEAG